MKTILVSFGTVFFYSLITNGDCTSFNFNLTAKTSPTSTVTATLPTGCSMNRDFVGATKQYRFCGDPNYCTWMANGIKPVSPFDYNAWKWWATTNDSQVKFAFSGDLDSEPSNNTGTCKIMVIPYSQNCPNVQTSFVSYSCDKSDYANPSCKQTRVSDPSQVIPLGSCMESCKNELEIDAYFGGLIDENLENYTLKKLISFVPRSNILSKFDKFEWEFDNDQTKTIIWDHFFSLSTLEASDEKLLPGSEPAPFAPLLDTMNFLEKQLANVEFVASNRFTIADIALTTGLKWFGNEIISDFPMVKKYFLRHARRPAFRKIVSQQEYPQASVGV